MNTFSISLNVSECLGSSSDVHCGPQGQGGVDALLRDAKVAGPDLEPLDLGLGAFPTVSPMSRAVRCQV